MRENALLFSILSLITAGPSLFLRYEESLRSPDELLSAPYLFLLAAYVISVYLLTAAVAKTAYLRHTGHMPSLRTCIGEIIRDFYALAAMAIVASFTLVSAVILSPSYPAAFILLVPGFFVDVVLAVLIPVRTIERTGFVASFVRSIELTKGHRWPLLGLVVALICLSLGYEVLIYLAVGDPALAEFERSGQVALTCLVLGDAAYGIVGAVVATVLYFELKLIKEGAGLETLAAEFD